MKPKSKERITTIKQPTKLFLEDLELIFSILQETMDKVEVENDDFEFDNIQDLSQIKADSLIRLKFFGYKNNMIQIFIYICPKYISIILKKDDPILIGTIEKIKEIFGARKRNFFLSPKTVLVFSIIGLVISVSYLGSQLFLEVKSFFFIPLIGMISSVLSLFFLYFSKNQIILSYSKNAPSFWKRNQDKIIIGIITSFLTLLLSFVLGRVFNLIP